MQKRSSTNKRRTAANSKTQVSLPEKNPAAVALGRLGGLKGGKARAEKLSGKRRQEIAKRAAQARWSIRPSD
jgi:ABC-type phosphate/phosphonate transport system ATPase subunit